MAILTAHERDRLPEHDFAIPESRKYPVPDEIHARNALARVTQFGSPEEKHRVREAVHKRYPHLADEADAYGGICGDGMRSYADGGEVETPEVRTPEPRDGGYGALFKAMRKHRPMIGAGR